MPPSLVVDAGLHVWNSQPKPRLLPSPHLQFIVACRRKGSSGSVAALPRGSFLRRCCNCQSRAELRPSSMRYRCGDNGTPLLPMQVCCHRSSGENSPAHHFSINTGPLVGSRQQQQPQPRCWPRDDEGAAAAYRTVM